MNDILNTGVATYLISKEVKSCSKCGKETNLIEVCSEAYFCGDDCTKEFYKELDSGVASISEQE